MCDNVNYSTQNTLDSLSLINNIDGQRLIKQAHYERSLNSSNLKILNGETTNFIIESNLSSKIVVETKRFVDYCNKRRKKLVRKYFKFVVKLVAN